jgi:hypothetical protein
MNAIWSGANFAATLFTFFAVNVHHPWYIALSAAFGVFVMMTMIKGVAWEIADWRRGF